MRYNTGVYLSSATDCNVDECAANNCTNGFLLDGSSLRCELADCTSNNTSVSFNNQSGQACSFTGCKGSNGGTGFSFNNSSGNSFVDCESRNTWLTGVGFTSTNGHNNLLDSCVAADHADRGFNVINGDCLLKDCVASDNAVALNAQGSRVRGSIETADSATIVATEAAQVTLHNSNFDPTKLTFTAYAAGRVSSQNHGGSGLTHVYEGDFSALEATTDFDAPAAGTMRSLLTSDVRRNADYPGKLRIPGIAVVANKLVTIKAMMRKAHATNVNGRLVVPGGQIAGVDADVVATLADNTDEQELTVTFTPTEAGVIAVEVWVEYVAGHAAVSIDRFTEISQA